MGVLKKLVKLMMGNGPLKRILTHSRLKFRWNNNNSPKWRNQLTQCNSLYNIRKFQFNKLNILKSLLSSNINNQLNSSNINNQLNSSNIHNQLNSSNTNNQLNSNIINNQLNSSNTN